MYSYFLVIFMHEYAIELHVLSLSAYICFIFVILHHLSATSRCACTVFAGIQFLPMFTCYIVNNLVEDRR